MPPARGRPWRRTVQQVLHRDNWTCHLCGQPGADSADHLIPHSQGGPDTPDNLAAVHHNVEPRCNRYRSDTPLDEYQPPDPPAHNW